MTQVVILTGFLGSGKTTILQKMLAEEENKGHSCAVLMNEIGDVSIDTALVNDGKASVREILNGCICCSSRDQFENALMATVQNDHPDTIFIECSGVSHPYEVVDSCMNPIIADQIQIAGTIAVLDALHFSRIYEEEESIAHLMMEQIKNADIIVLSKTDLLDPEALMAVNDRLQALHLKERLFQPHGAIQTPLDQLLQLTTVHHGEHDHLHVHHHLHIDTLTYTFQQPISVDDFEEWLRQLPDNIVRIKGFIDFKEFPQKCTLFQYSFGVPLYQEYEMNLTKNLVIIGQHLDKEKLIQQLKALEK